MRGMRLSAAELLHRTGTNLMRAGPARRLALRVAQARRRAMVFVYHRVTPEGKQRHEVVANVSLPAFRAQLDILATIGDIVPLSALLTEPRSRGRVRFAITFDDDEPCHVQHAIPMLRSLGVPATFFLSGRSLHGLDAYWWMLLERLIEAEGVERAGAVLGFMSQTAEDLAAVCESVGLPIADRLAALVRAGDRAVLAPGDFPVFLQSGMEVGFHTLHHPVLTTLPDADLTGALQVGRSELAGAVGGTVDLLAYPHGRTNGRVARSAKDAGYRAAFRTGRRPVAPHDDPFVLWRWDIGSVPIDRLAACIALGLNYPTGAPPE
jgi:peptidoglycan/xylan/chitin deacetylase (PgdA/CDA1 family)